MRYLSHPATWTSFDTQQRKLIRTPQKGKEPLNRDKTLDSASTHFASSSIAQHMVKQSVIWSSIFSIVKISRQYTIVHCMVHCILQVNVMCDKNLSFEISAPVTNSKFEIAGCVYNWHPDSSSYRSQDMKYNIISQAVTIGECFTMPISLEI